VEESVTTYLRDLIVGDDSLRFLEDPKQVLDVAVDIEKQSVQESQVVLTGTVDVMHYGDQGIIDLAALLTFLVNKNKTDSYHVYLDDLIGLGAAVDSIDFSFITESVALASNLTVFDESTSNDGSGRTSSEKTLIVVVTLLSITVLGLSSVLCWIGGGWIALRKQVKVLLLREEELTRMTLQHDTIKQKPTEETEDDDNSPSRESQTNFTNPSGVLGVHGIDMYGSDRLQGLGIKTPARLQNDFCDPDDDNLATPMSTYSDTDRAPIGIMSMRKLVGADNAIHQHSEGEEEEDSEELDEEAGNVENYQTKKLQY
jgi:hypothetical protein